MNEFVLSGTIADLAIHDKGDGNPHAHILPDHARMDEDGKWLPKAREVYDLDENGERIRLPSGKAGKAIKTHRGLGRAVERGEMEAGLGGPCQPVS